MNINKNQLKEMIRHELYRLTENNAGPPGAGPESKYQQIRHQFNRKVVNDALETIAGQLGKVGSTEGLAHELSNILGKLGITEEVFEKVRHYIPKQLGQQAPPEEAGTAPAEEELYDVGGGQMVPQRHMMDYQGQG